MVFDYGDQMLGALEQSLPFYDLYVGALDGDMAFGART